MEVEGTPAKKKQLVLLKSGKLSDSSISGKLPTACFINGEYKRVKTEYGKKGAEQIQLGQKEQACYKASFQSVNQGDEETEGLLASMAVAYVTAPSKPKKGKEDGIKEVLANHSLPTNSVKKGAKKGAKKKYQFYNSANQGLYITPESKLADLAKSKDSSNLIVNFQTDAGGMVLGGWLPIAEKT